MIFRARLVLLVCLAASAFSSFAATFTVTNGGDAGAGTLRQAILDANANPGRDRITFTTNVFLSSSLPYITDAVDIDGALNTGGKAQIDFDLLYDGFSIFNFVPGSSTSTLRSTWLIKGIALRVFPGVTSVVVTHNFIQGGTSISGTNTRIGGSDPADGNNITLLQLSAAQSATVISNTIGSVLLIGGANNRIGAPGDGNTISWIDNQDAVGTIIEANTLNSSGGYAINLRVAVAGAGPSILSNQIVSTAARGIIVRAPNALIQGNTIANHDLGVAVYNDAAFGPPFVNGARITANAIYGNDIGIDLEADGPTPNDAAPDADTGANHRQNFPVLSSAVYTTGSLLVQGSLTSAPATQYAIEIFSNAASDPQPRTYLGTFNVTTDASGTAAFTRTVTTSLPVSGEVITSTATGIGGVPVAGNGLNETSEISAPVALSTPGSFNFTATTVTVNEGDGTATLTVQRTGGSDGTVTVDYATANGTANAPSDFTQTSGTLTFGPGVTSQSIIVPIVSDEVPESEESFTLTLSNPSGGAALGNATVTVVIAAQIVADPVPTLSQWGFIALAMGLAAVMWLRTR